jgi:hypothetical protein
MAPIIGRYRPDRGVIGGSRADRGYWLSTRHATPTAAFFPLRRPIALGAPIRGLTQNNHKGVGFTRIISFYMTISTR